MLLHQLSNPERYTGLLMLLPVFIWVTLSLRGQFSTREYAGAFLGFAWLFLSSLIINIFLLKLGNFWQFNMQYHLFYGVPMDFLIGQAIFLSAMIVLPLHRIALAGKLLIATILLYTLYALFVSFKPLWWAGLGILFLFSVLPSLVLAKWTKDDEHLYLRSMLQYPIWICVLLWLFPSIIFEATEHSWSFFLNRAWWQNCLYVVPLILPGVILFSALKQFAIEGDGTAFPYDPPKKLVYKGIYAYLSNPMQVGICLMMAWWGVLTHSLYISISSILGLILFITFKDICNGSCSLVGNSPEWFEYQQNVPKWIPRRTPWKGPKCKKEGEA